MGMTTYDLRNAIDESINTLKSGSLTFWGHWFGKPYENVHQIVGADASDGSIVIYFDHGETLIVDQLVAWSLESGKLVIKDAERIRFRWFDYGRQPGPDSLRFEEYRKMDGKLTFATDFMGGARSPVLDLREAAVELHTL